MQIINILVDLTKAFDTVSREGLWKIMAKYGCPPKFVTIVRLLHDGMMARVVDNGNPSEPFEVSNGVKQGCVLAPTLIQAESLPHHPSQEAAWHKVAGQRMPDTEVLTRAGLPSIHMLLKKAQLRWAGHVARLPDYRLPKKLLFGVLQHEKRSTGGPKKRFKDSLKKSLKVFHIKPATWEQAAHS